MTEQFDVVDKWTGRDAHALRRALRMSAEAFAEYLDVSPRAVRGWDKNPNCDLAARTEQLLDVALDRADHGARARFTLLRQQVEAPPTNPAWPPAFLSPGDLSAAPAPRSDVVTTPESVAYFAHRLGDHYRADNLLGPAVLLPSLRGHLITLEQMRVSADSSLLRQVLKVGAGYAEFAGWLSQDSGDAAGARSYYSLAHEWAEAAGDHRMASFVLMRRSVQAIAQQDGAYAANLAQAAQRDRSPTTARVRALAAQTEALGHAVAGDASEAARALDTAEAFTAEAADVPADGDPSDGRYCALPLYLRISRAKVALTLGDGEQAVAAFEDVLQALPPEYRRDRGQYLARIAQASVLAGLPEQACAHAVESLNIARETGSTRTIDDLRKLVTGLDKRWADLREVNQLRASLDLSPTHR